MRVWTATLLGIIVACAAGVSAQNIGTTPLASMPQVGISSGSASVNAIVEYNNHIIIGGRFTQVDSSTRTGLAAIDKTTGALHSWDPAIGGVIDDMEVIGDMLFIAGTFSSVDSQTRTQLAGFDLTQMNNTNHGLLSWDPVLSNNTTPFFFGSDVECLASMGNTLYVGGFFGQVNNNARGGVASFDTTNLNNNDGLTQWDPNTYTNSSPPFVIWGVFSIVTHASSDTVYLNGPFEGVGGTHLDDNSASPHTATARQGFAAVSGSGTGAVTSWNPNPGTTSWVDDGMAIVGDVIYHGASRGNSPLGMNANNSSTPFTNFNPQLDDHALAIGVHPTGSPVVMSSSLWSTAGSTSVNELLSFDTAGNLDTTWDPNPNAHATTLFVTSDRVYVGGAFTTISGQSRTGFAVYDITLPSPTITTGTTLPGGNNGQTYQHQFNATGGTAPYTWSANGLPSGWSLSNTGMLDASAASVSTGTYNFNVTVTDNASQTDNDTFSVTIAPPALQITTGATLPGGQTGQGYNQQFAAQGGTQPYSWAANGLPSGWSMSNSGMLSAASSNVTPGTFNFTATVNDSGSQNDSGNFSVTITAPALNITSSSTLPGGTAGVSYNAQLTATGGFGSYSWAGTGLPSGWTLNSSTGLVDAPSASVVAGTFNFSVQVNDQSSQSDSMAVSVTIAAAGAPLAISSSSTLPNGMQGTAYTFQFTATGGQGSYTWSVTPGNLPTNWTLNSSSGVLSAAAADVIGGNYNWNIQVADNTSNVSQSVSLTIDVPTLTISGGLGAGENGQAYSATLTASGGSGSGYIWIIDAGQLPPGVTMNAPTGATAAGFSGTPTLDGSFGVTIRVTDDQANTTTAVYTVTISAPGSTGGSGSSGSDSGDSSGGGCFVGAESTSALVLLLILAGLGVTALRRRTA